MYILYSIPIIELLVTYFKHCYRNLGLKNVIANDCFIGIVVHVTNKVLNLWWPIYSTAGNGFGEFDHLRH